MNVRAPHRDAGATATEYVGFRWAYLVLSFGLLASVAYRNLVLQESAWDLLTLVLLGGIVLTASRVRHGTPSASSARGVLAAMLLALAVGAGLALLAR